MTDPMQRFRSQVAIIQLPTVAIASDWVFNILKVLAQIIKYTMLKWN